MLHSERTVAKDLRKVRQPRERKSHHLGREKLRGATCARTSGATWGSGWRKKRVGGASVRNRCIALEGENLGEGKTQEGLD
jgi:hypothetical protein